MKKTHLQSDRVTGRVSGLASSIMSRLVFFLLRLIIVSNTLLFSPAVIASDVVRIQELPLPQAGIMNEFEFARIVYDGGYEWPRWRADWPDAEYHFNQGLNRLTRIDAASDGVLVNLTDDAIFDHPWLYVVEVGYMYLSKPEIANLREYLLRGGFLMVDDFHGKAEWQQFASVMRAVFPERPLVPVGEESDLFDIHYEITELVQIPGIRSVMNGRTWEKGGVNPGWFVVRDDNNRIMVAVNFNQDLGDAWEHADDALYPEVFTGQAYRLGVNYVIYAMTH